MLLQHGILSMTEALAMRVTWRSLDIGVATLYEQGTLYDMCTCGCILAYTAIGYSDGIAPVMTS